MDRVKGFFVAVSPCLLNQAIRADGVRTDYETIVMPLLNALIDECVGIYVLPCCEVPYEGLNRKAGFKRYQEDEGFQKYCMERAQAVKKELSMMRRGGMGLLAIIGVGGSPTCAVDNLNRRTHSKGRGIFMSALSGLDDYIFTEFDQYSERKTLDEIVLTIRKGKELLK